MEALWEKGAVFQGLVSVVSACPSLECPFVVLQGRVVVVVQKASSYPPEWNRRTLSFSLCQLSPIESEACFKKSLCFSQHFPDTPCCCKISTGANICFWDIKTSFWVCF